MSYSPSVVVPEEVAESEETEATEGVDDAVSIGVVVSSVVVTSLVLASVDAFSCCFGSSTFAWRET